MEVYSNTAKSPARYGTLLRELGRLSSHNTGAAAVDWAHRIHSMLPVLASDVGGHQPRMPVIGKEDHFVTIWEARTLS